MEIEYSEIEWVNSISGVVINGISEGIVRNAILAGIESAKGTLELVKISAGNYGGKLGNYRI